MQRVAPRVKLFKMVCSWPRRTTIPALRYARAVGNKYELVRTQDAWTFCLLMITVRYELIKQEAYAYLAYDTGNGPSSTVVHFETNFMISKNTVASAVAFRNVYVKLVNLKLSTIVDR